MTTPYLGALLLQKQEKVMCLGIMQRYDIDTVYCSLCHIIEFYNRAFDCVEFRYSKHMDTIKNNCESFSDPCIQCNKEV